MAAPKFAPVPAIGSLSSYRSPAHVPGGWEADRPADLDGRQPVGSGLGFQGPDQGYALRLAARLRPQLVLIDVERPDDAVAGCAAIGTRRASLYGRAPVIHDVRIAFTIWGFLDPATDAELVELRVKAFERAADAHHYEVVRALVERVPEPTLRMTPAAVEAAYPAQWRELLGVG
jgi:hypothetical protein